jgi:hypothetical protein
MLRTLSVVAALIVTSMLVIPTTSIAGASDFKIAVSV